MKDTEIRGIVLQKFYEKRREKKFFPQSETWEEIEIQDVYRICKQLHENGLIDWNGIPNNSSNTEFYAGGLGAITAKGIDVIEETKEPPISITIHQDNRITVGNISNASNVNIGSGNIQIENQLKEIIDAINSTQAPPEEKSKARDLLKKFMEHPLVAAIAGGAISLLGK